MIPDNRFIQFRGVDAKPILFNKEHILFVVPDHASDCTLIYLATPIDFMDTQKGPTEYKIVASRYEEVAERLMGCGE